jgi:hypothetical protein
VPVTGQNTDSTTGVSESANYAFMAFCSDPAFGGCGVSYDDTPGALRVFTEKSQGKIIYKYTITQSEAFDWSPSSAGSCPDCGHAHLGPWDCMNGGSTCWTTTSSFTLSGEATATASGTGSADAFEVGKPSLNESKGTATLSVRVPGKGKLTLKAKGVHAVSKRFSRKGVVKLTIRPTAATLRKLRQTRSAQLKATVVYLPAHGKRRSRTLTITLRLGTRGRRRDRRPRRR